MSEVTSQWRVFYSYPSKHSHLALKLSGTFSASNHYFYLYNLSKKTLRSISCRSSVGTLTDAAYFAVVGRTNASSLIGSVHMQPKTSIFSHQCHNSVTAEGLHLVHKLASNTVAGFGVFGLNRKTMAVAHNSFISK